MPDFEITHQTIYRHGAPASAAWQMLQLQPREEEGQACLDFQLELHPAAADLTTREDFFGNTHHYFSVCDSHTELSITSRAVVRRANVEPPLAAVSPPVAEVRQRTRELIQSGVGYLLEQYLGASPQVPLPPAAAKLAEGLSSELPILEWIGELGRRFSAAYTFDTTATVVSTPFAEVLEKKRGVCQDLSHQFISCVRQQGLAAGYVSGYLLSSPPPGQPRLHGADAMHAWVSIHVPELGWIDYDPTNACFAGTGHIVVARGRDYGDVSPTRGVFNGSQSPVLFIGVTVEQVDA